MNNLNSLYLRNFRNYEEVFVTFSSGINQICGANAQGKTTLLEAIYFLITGRSFRPSQLIDLIRKDTAGFYLEARFEKYGIRQDLKIIYDGNERRIFHNDTQHVSAASLLGLLPGVALTPNDSALVKGAPQLRRQYLDLQIAQIDPLYVHHLNRFGRAMRQRNFLLRSKNISTIESWEHEMASSAAYLTVQRAKTIADLQKMIPSIYYEISGEAEGFELKYRSFIDSYNEVEALRLAFLKLWEKMRRREMELGFTINGPHKDDFEIGIGTNEARYFASEGQQRTCAAALRIAEWRRLHHFSQDHPLLLIDDFGIGLDMSRQKKLFSEMAELGQVFLTATQSLPSEWLNLRESIVFEVQNGKIQKKN